MWAVSQQLDLCRSRPGAYWSVSDTEQYRGDVVASGRGLHEAPRRELLPGVTRRAAVLVIGVLLLQLGFVLSYVGAFHAPTPRDVPLAVVPRAGAPAGPAGSVADRLEGIAGDPLDVRTADTEDDARQLLADREVDGVLL